MFNSTCTTLTTVCEDTACFLQSRFTGKERDAESGNDYFPARYYASSMGRWLSPDWSAKADPIPYATMDNPQSLNLYAYMDNRPLNGIDAEGHVPMSWGGFQNCAGANVSKHCQDLLADAAKQQAAVNQPAQKQVGNTSVGSLAKVLTNEVGSLSTLKGSDSSELEKGKTALANALINNAERAHPNKVAPATGTASGQDEKIMEKAYTNRANGVADPVQGRTYYGTSHYPDLISRSAGNGLPGAAGRETVFARFGPFHDSQTPHTPTYIYIYNDPGH